LSINREKQSEQNVEIGVHFIFEVYFKRLRPVSHIKLTIFGYLANPFMN